MNAAPLTPAQATAAVASKARERGASVPIPGALDVPRARADRQSPATAPPSAQGPVIASTDIQRQEYAREGGGAPSERRGRTHQGWFGQLLGLLRSGA